ncbi:MAG: transposase zinc-binding domain-containing protein, partial [Myxococcota bacterium]
MASCAAPRVYARRRPETTDLYRAVAENLDLFLDTYDERFLTQHGLLTRAARRSLDAFLACGCLHAGFARLKCDDCGKEMLVAYSCQKKGPCSSCQQKRAEILCRFIQEEVVEPVNHRQLVFVVPKMLRQNFHRDREMLTALCRAAADATQQFYRCGLGRDDVSV